MLDLGRRRHAVDLQGRKGSTIFGQGVVATISVQLAACPIHEVLRAGTAPECADLAHQASYGLLRVKCAPLDRTKRMSLPTTAKHVANVVRRGDRNHCRRCRNPLGGGAHWDTAGSAALADLKPNAEVKRGR